MLNKLDEMTKAGTVFADWLKPVAAIAPQKTPVPVTAIHRSLRLTPVYPS
eukprot:NODE_1733_length_1317_cov_5.040221_g1443_i0.p10 GENE.NODE_1733_length_1317_cov_5.040221_g1443_i0~~NODE_1733_length_1317_cov_5.040221_g1443_i0.p10  ORF type:complete len:50 (-),score=9.22 NODE_1733_length_1317_cov_5.040221_g1443_i0:733-882(-)